MSSETEYRPGRRRFSQEEDEKLIRLIHQYGSRDWAVIAEGMPGRNPRQCRHRYNNYLTENYQHAPWTTVDDDLLIAKYRELGAKWVQISRFFERRSGNDVKNRWYKYIVKYVLPDEKTASKTKEEEPKKVAPPVIEDVVQSNTGMKKEKPGLIPFLQYALN
jgi:hypothetical protein